MQEHVCSVNHIMENDYAKAIGISVFQSNIQRYQAVIFCMPVFFNYQDQVPVSRLSIMTFLSWFVPVKSSDFLDAATRIEL
jgi:hypothetical protein